MPAPEKAGRTDDAILWPYIGVDADNEDIRSEGIAIKVKWDVEKFKNDEGGVNFSGAVTVDRDIEVKSLMKLGSLAHYLQVGSGLGLLDDEVYIVTHFERVKNTKGRSALREVKLVKYRSKPPDLPRVGTPASVNLTIHGAGFINGTCLDCGLMNADKTANLQDNDRDKQTWISETFVLCASQARWAVTRNLVSNVVTLSLVKLGVGNYAIWRMTGVEWNGIDLVDLDRSSADASCGFPFKMFIEGQP